MDAPQLRSTTQNHPAFTRRPAVRAASFALIGLGLAATIAGCASAADAESGSGSGTDSGSTVDESYTDGTYEAEGGYQSPGGSETIDVSITIADDIVTAVEVTPHATSGNAKQFQTQFAGGIADVVVGEDIDQLNVSRVAGSSLTSGGFNEALEKIKAEALAS